MAFGLHHQSLVVQVFVFPVHHGLLDNVAHFQVDPPDETMLVLGIQLMEGHDHDHFLPSTVAVGPFPRHHPADLVVFVEV